MLSGLFQEGWLLQTLYRIPAIIVALAFHEYAHAYAAYRKGDPTAYNLGRMTLNPITHIDPFGLIMLLLVGFGWARPVPINPRNFRNKRVDEIIVSLAGVATNFVLAFVSMGVYYAAVLLFKVDNAIFANLFYSFYFINLGLCIFNLLPIPPLDGYHVLENLLIRRVGPNFFVYFERYGNFILIALLLTGALTGLMSAAVGGIMRGMMTFYDLIFGL